MGILIVLPIHKKDVGKQWGRHQMRQNTASDQGLCHLLNWKNKVISKIRSKMRPKKITCVSANMPKKFRVGRQENLLF